jgi:hypothetical protein
MVMLKNRSFCDLFKKLAVANRAKGTICCLPSMLLVKGRVTHITIRRFSDLRTISANQLRNFETIPVKTNGSDGRLFLGPTGYPSMILTLCGRPHHGFERLDVTPLWLSRFAIEKQIADQTFLSSTHLSILERSSAGFASPGPKAHYPIGWLRRQAVIRGTTPESAILIKNFLPSSPLFLANSMRVNLQHTHKHLSCAPRLPKRFSRSGRLSNVGAWN